MAEKTPQVGKLVGLYLRVGDRKGNKQMFFRVMLFVWQSLFDLVAVMCMTNDDKNSVILLLRQQMRIMARKQAWRPQIPRWQKVPLAALAGRVQDQALKDSDCRAWKRFVTFRFLDVCGA